MKSALLLSLIVCLVESGLPVAAQERVDSPTGPIRQAIIREAAELAADYSAIDSSTQQRGGDDWSRVRNLPPGTKIIVTVRGSPPAQRSFLAADEFALTVADPTIDKIARTDII